MILLLIYRKSYNTDGDIQVPIKKRRAQNALSLAELKIELLKTELSVEGSKSVLRMRLESSKLDNLEMTKKLVEVEQLRLYCFRHDLSEILRVLLNHLKLILPFL